MQVSQVLSPIQLLRYATVGDAICSSSRRLVEVPYTASLANTMNALAANDIVAVPVAAPPGHWIGAGGSMILESDKATGVVRKHFIGMVTMLDILHHIPENCVDDRGKAVDLDTLLGIPISSIIGRSLEGLSMWTFNPSTSILDCMEMLSKGVHRALVPVESSITHLVGVELADSSPGYQMLTQTDVLKFLMAHERELNEILSWNLAKLGAINENVFGMTNRIKMMDAIKCMKSCSLGAIPIVEASEDHVEDNNLIDGRGRKLVGTLSATDLRGCLVVQLPSLLSLTIGKFFEKVAVSSQTGSEERESKELHVKRLVTCNPGTSLSEAIREAVHWHVHRLWVINLVGNLTGVVTLTDIFRVVRATLLDQEAGQM